MRQGLPPAAAHRLEVGPGPGGRDDEAPVSGRGAPQIHRLLGLDDGAAGRGDLVTLPLVPAAQLLGVTSDQVSSEGQSLSQLT